MHSMFYINEILPIIAFSISWETLSKEACLLPVDPHQSAPHSTLSRTISPFPARLHLPYFHTHVASDKFGNNLKLSRHGSESQDSDGCSPLTK